jgi:hypothetical protein
MATPSSAQQQVTQLLVDWSSGDAAALDKLIPLVQPELHRLAHYYMSREGEGHTLQTTALGQRGVSSVCGQDTSALAKPATLFRRRRATDAAHHG